MQFTLDVESLEIEKLYFIRSKIINAMLSDQSSLLYYCTSGFKVLTFHNDFPIHYFSCTYAAKPQDAALSELAIQATLESSIPW